MPTSTSLKRTRRALAPMLSSLLAAATLAFVAPQAGAVDLAPSDLTWSPTQPAPGSTLDISFKGCNVGEDVLVRVWLTSGAPAVDNTVSALAAGVVNHVSAMIPDTWGSGAQFGVAVFCGGSYTSDPNRSELSFGNIGDGSTTTTAASTTTSPPASSTTTAPSTTTGSTGSTNTPSEALAANAVTASPRYTG